VKSEEKFSTKRYIKKASIFRKREALHGKAFPIFLLLDF
jgi:hypothetical protein